MWKKRSTIFKRPPVMSLAELAKLKEVSKSRIEYLAKLNPLPNVELKSGFDHITNQYKRDELLKWFEEAKTKREIKDGKAS